MEGRKLKKKCKKEVHSDDEEVPAKKRKIEPKKKAAAKQSRIKTETKPEKKPKIKLELNNFTPSWSIHELLAEHANLDIPISRNLTKLFQEGNTIPFIARYRKNESGNISAENLRDIKQTFDDITTLNTKIESVSKQLAKLDVLTDELQHKVACSKSIEELELIYAPYKPESKRTLAARAKEAGLEEPALNILHNRQEVDLSNYLNKKDLLTIDAVEKGIIYIISSIISSDTDILSLMRDLKKSSKFPISCTKSSSKTKPDSSKFDTYLNFEGNTSHIKPHQVLAINRAESQKILSIKITIPSFIHQTYTKQCTKKWLKTPTHSDTIAKAIEDAYTRSIQPHLIREIRSDLKTKAEKAANEVFSTNLKHLLLAPPLKGKTILAIDPGFSNGCKMALVSPIGALIAHNVIYPHKNPSAAIRTVKTMLREGNCDLIALGNGKACRQTEEFLSKAIQSGDFEVRYTIVNEDGASIYSCSPEAQAEFPALDPNIISAVSLARRLQDPLSELVKIEPKHLGVGMYQHDLKKKQLEESLNGVVSECVSFVGVDLNTASKCILKHVAGLSDKRAAQIIEHRQQNGRFKQRKELLKVAGIGSKIFEQCAGFLRVGPLGEDEQAFYGDKAATKLDRTYIHPESYKIAGKVMKALGLREADVGNREFIAKVKAERNGFEVARLASEWGTSCECIGLIFDAFCQELNHDLRDFSKQEVLFKKGLMRIEDLNVGDVLTGRVSNVTHFGCFVDVGVGQNGLIHMSRYNGFSFQIGDKVEAKVLDIDAGRQRLGLQAINKI